MPGTLDTLDLAPLLPALKRLGYPAARLGPLLNLIRRAVQDDTRRSFATGKDVNGVPFRPVKKKGGKILVGSGKLRAGTRTRVRGAVVEEYTTIPYAAFHQGGIRPPYSLPPGGRTRRLPVRRFLGFGTRIEPEVRRLLAEFIKAVTPD